VLREGRLAHVGVANGRDTAVLPMLYAYTPDRRILVHGSTGAGALSTAASGLPATFVVTLLDGYVLADRIVNNAANYRCAMLFGFFVRISPEARPAALELMSECIVPGRWAELPAPTRKKYAMATVLEFVVQEASLKIRTGEPALQHNGSTWAGLVPLQLTVGVPKPARACVLLPLPDSVQRLVKAFSQ
jgi:nitroimidazol reductase NimA-like FMN-containing flavoprotein (pyridoxamine 5'-phosphate oxidase superfamily)